MNSWSTVPRWLILVASLAGCTAAKSGYHLVKAEQAYAAAVVHEASERAPYAWTMADSYMKKAREEWGHSDFEASEQLSAKAVEWATRAAEVAESSRDLDALDSAPEVVPEEVERTDEPEQPAIQPAEGDKIDNPWDDEFLEDDFDLEEDL